jgi:hypothetical protein
MKKIFIFFVMVLLVSCNTAKTITLSYNHVTDEVRVNDSLQNPHAMDVWNQLDDEFEIVIHKHRIKSITPVGFKYEYEPYYTNGRVYFYSPDMSKYMADNEWFTFIVVYKKRLNE